MPTNTFATIIPAIAQYVLRLSPEGLMDSDRARLESAVKGERDYVQIEFIRGADRQVRCDLAARLDRSDAERTTDDEGNLWAEYDLRIEVGWSSFGSTGAATAQRRIDLMQAVTHLAVALEREFGTKVQRLIATKAERDAAARAEAEREIERRAEKVVEAHRKGLRVLQDVTLTPAQGQAFGTLPVPSLHNITTPDGRKYVLRLGEQDPDPRAGFANFVRRVS